MPILSPTDLGGVVAYLGLNLDRAETMASAPVDRVEVGYGGFLGESRGGLTRPSCSRVKLQYPRGTEIRNTRQICLVSTEELSEIAEAMGLSEPLRPEWLGANLALTGLPRLTELPPAARLIFETPDGPGASLVVDMENAPCKQPSALIEARWPGAGRRFPAAARGRRGVTAWVEKPGALALGDRCRLHIPPQRVYAPAQKRVAAP